MAQRPFFVAASLSQSVCQTLLLLLLFLKAKVLPKEERGCQSTKTQRTEREHFHSLLLT